MRKFKVALIGLIISTLCLSTAYFNLFHHWVDGYISNLEAEGMLGFAIVCTILVSFIIDVVLEGEL